MSRIRRRSAGQKGWDRLVPDVEARRNKQAQIAANRVIASVIERGPNYSGRFRTQWIADPVGPSTEPATVGGLAPLLKQPAPGSSSERGYTIRNESPYAPEAMDLEPGVWIRPVTRPEGEIVDEGERVGAFRGEVDSTGEGDAISTAERDWYVNYATKGDFAKDVKQGAKSAVVRRAR